MTTPTLSPDSAARIIASQAREVDSLRRILESYREGLAGLRALLADERATAEARIAGAYVAGLSHGLRGMP